MFLHHHRIKAVLALGRILHITADFIDIELGDGFLMLDHPFAKRSEGFAIILIELDGALVDILRSVERHLEHFVALTAVRIALFGQFRCRRQAWQIRLCR